MAQFSLAITPFSGTYHGEDHPSSSRGSNRKLPAPAASALDTSKTVTDLVGQSFPRSHWNDLWPTMEIPGAICKPDVDPLHLSAFDLTEIMPALAKPKAEAFISFVKLYFFAYQIDTIDRVAAFIGNTAVESRQWTALEENLNYSAEALMRLWPHRFPKDVALAYARKPEMIANRAYADRGGNGGEASGDGWRYRGRGLIQITHRDAYEKFTKDTGIDIAGDPGLVATPRYAVFTACWYWHVNHLNELASAGQFLRIGQIINGTGHRPPNLWQRREYFRKTAARLLRSHASFTAWLQWLKQ